MKKFQIVGKSSYAIAIILDILKLQNPDKIAVDIISNIPDEQNTSLKSPFKLDGIEVKEYYADDWTPDEGKFIIGSIGRGRHIIFKSFLDSHKIRPEQYQNIIHPKAVVASSVILGHGVHISPLSVIAPFAVFGDFTVVNRNCGIGHHTQLQDFACVNPGCNIAGLVNLGKHTTIGAGATIIDSIKIGEHTVVGAGSVVTKDIAEKIVVYGSPAKFVRDNK